MSACAATHRFGTNLSVSTSYSTTILYELITIATVNSRRAAARAGYWCLCTGYSTCSSCSSPTRSARGARRSHFSSVGGGGCRVRGAPRGGEDHQVGPFVHDLEVLPVHL